jgi:hypothetical protein
MGWLINPDLSGIKTETDKIPLIKSDTEDIQSKVIDVKTETDKIPSVIEDTEDIQLKIGNNTQIWANSTKTILAYNNTTYKHIHNPAYVYPANAADKSVTSGAGAWELGSLTELIPANTIDVSFDIHWLNVSNMSAVGTYYIELHLVDGDLNSTKYLGAVKVTSSAAQDKADNAFIQIPVIPANSRVGIRVADSTTSSRTISLSVHYHDYE